MRVIRPGKGHSQKVVRCHLCQRSRFEIDAKRTPAGWQCKGKNDCYRAIINAGLTWAAEIVEGTDQ